MGRRTPTRNLILALIRDEPGLSAGAIADRLGMPHNRVRAGLRRLANRGDVFNDGGWKHTRERCPNCQCWRVPA